MRVLALAALALLLAGCATPPMAAHQPTLRNVQALRAADVPLIELGAFELAPGRPARMDRLIEIRASVLRAPNDGTFSSYLRQTLEAELQAAGKLAVDGDVVLSAQLTQSAIETSPPDSRGAVAARFVLTRAGAVVFDRELVAREEWPSSFIGAIAIPQAMDRYTALYPTLVTMLLTDPEFRAALRAR
jgi:hypothetical protein